MSALQSASRHNAVTIGEGDREIVKPNGCVRRRNAGDGKGVSFGGEHTQSRDIRQAFSQGGREGRGVSVNVLPTETDQESNRRCKAEHTRDIGSPRFKSCRYRGQVTLAEGYALHNAAAEISRSECVESIAFAIKHSDSRRTEHLVPGEG